MKRKFFYQEGHSLKIALFFCIFVFTVLFVSFFIRLVSVINKSNFDGRHRFTIAVFLEKPKNVKSVLNNTVVFSFSPNAKNVAVLNISNQHFRKDTLARTLGIPVDGFVVIPLKINTALELIKKLPIKEENKVDDYLKTMSIHYTSLSTNLTIIDIIRLWFLTKGSHARDFTFKELEYDDRTNDITYELFLDKIVSQLFTDEFIQQERVSIQIINGTDIVGLGNRLARLITNIGGNVVAVSTSDTIIKKSEITYNANSYTFEKLAKLLRYKTIKIEKSDISDIVIKLGIDTSATTTF